MNIDYSKFNYSVPDIWYKGLYKDKVAPCNAGRSFSLLNDEKSEECWLLVTGFRGYPGELVRPAYDLYLEGYDVFVPRLPGCGTSTEDFIKTDNFDWINVIIHAIQDLSKKYQKINLLGHSMGAAICSIVGNNNPYVNKIVYAAPSFENLDMPWYLRFGLAGLAIIKRKTKAKWARANLHHHFYENAPSDENYLGEQYYRWNFPKQLLMYYQIAKDGVFALSPHEHLLICPLKDKSISVPSCKIFKKVLKDKTNIVEIEKGTHFIFYDINEEAIEKACKAVIDFANK